MSNYNQIIAVNLIDLRKRQNLTQQDFAKLFNYSDKTISKWELGYAIPNVETLKEIADYYGVTIDYFLEPHAEIPHEVDSKVKFITRKQRRLLLIILFDLAFALIGATIFVALATTKEQIYYWPIIVWTAFIVCLFNSFITNSWWKHTLLPYIFSSLTIWVGLLGFYLSFWLTNEHYNFWYLFFVGLPVQLGTIIILTLTHSSTRD